MQVNNKISFGNSSDRPSNLLPSAVWIRNSSDQAMHNADAVSRIVDNPAAQKEIYGILKNGRKIQGIIGYFAAFIEKEISGIKDFINKSIDSLKSGLDFKRSQGKQTGEIAKKRLEGQARILESTGGKVESAYGLPEFEKKLYKFLGGLVAKIKNSKLYKNIVEKKIEKGIGFSVTKAKDLKLLASLIMIGQAGKEVVGGIVYTVQAYTNKDLPPDKRVFVAAYDGIVGAISSTLQLVTGLALIAYQDKYIDKGLNALGLNKTKNICKGVKAGLIFAIPLIVTNILIKRVIAPAFGTPIAGILKKKLMKDDKQSSINNDNTETLSKNSAINTPMPHLKGNGNVEKLYEMIALGKFKN